MKILWLSHLIPYPPKGGVLQRSYNLIKEAAKKVDIYLLSIAQKKQLLSMGTDLNEARRELEKICCKVEFLFPEENNKFTAFKTLFSKLPYTAKWRVFPEVRNAVRNMQDIHDIDLVHFDSIDLGEYYIETEPGIKKILNHHNIESQMMWRRAQVENNPALKAYFYLEAWKLERYENKMCSKFDLNLTVSALDRDRLRRSIPDLLVDVIENGVDTDYFKPQKTLFGSKSLIFAGGMGWYPNRSAMIFFARKVWPLLKMEFDDVKATVIGHNPPDELVVISKNDQNFKVTGFVDDVRPYFNRADVYICPISDGGGTKLKILDALSMAKPIVAHPVAIEGIDVQPGKHVLIAKTPAEFVRQITRLFDDQKLWNDLSSSGRSFAQDNYDFKAIGKKLVTAYKRTIRG